MLREAALGARHRGVALGARQGRSGGQPRINVAGALLADAVAEIRVRTLGDILLDLRPVPAAVADFLARGADR